MPSFVEHLDLGMVVVGLVVVLVDLVQLELIVEASELPGLGIHEVRIDRGVQFVEVEVNLAHDGDLFLGLGIAGLLGLGLLVDRRILIPRSPGPIVSIRGNVLTFHGD